jgi:integrase
MPKKILTLEACNDRLISGMCDVRLEKQGNRLYLRATLPHKELTGITKQYKVSLGCTCDEANLQWAEAKAWEMHYAKNQQRFDWKDWDRSVHPEKTEYSASHWIEVLRKKKINQDGIALDTWETRYFYFYKKLNPDKPITLKALLDVVRSTPENSRHRKSCCEAIARLAKEIELKIDLKPYQGTWTRTKITPRNLVSDEQIVEIHANFRTGRMEVERWKFLYCLLAVYGLRPHEALFCEIENSGDFLCHVLEGKTGPREVVPLYPEWAERWKVWELDRLPPIEKRSHRYVGQRITKVLGRDNYLGFQPYNLRHSYAIRGMKTGIPERAMASFMGHSVEEHRKTYQRWLKASDAKETWVRAMERRSEGKF